MAPGIPTMTRDPQGRPVAVCSHCYLRPPAKGDTECELCIMLASYAPPADVACPVCGAHGFTPCDVWKHARAIFDSGSNRR